MRYKIFEFDTKQKTIREGYDLVAEYYHRLKDLRGMPYGFKEIHDNTEEAIAEIYKYKKDLAGRDLTIIPLIQVDWSENIT